MTIRDPGVLDTSEIYFHTPSETAKRLYFYVRCAGRFQCNARYAVRHQAFDSFLLMHVVRGSGYVEVDGREQPVGAGAFVLMDCYRPHAYGTRGHWDILWMHFDGALARDHFDLIMQGRGAGFLLPNPYPVMRSMEKIVRMYGRERSASEAVVNKHIVSILTDLLTGAEDHEGASASGLDELLMYIARNMDQPLTLGDMARRASLSPYHFTRVFKRETGHTPHDYLLKIRVDSAKFYLRTGDLPCKDIAYRCGFQSASGFCTAFKRATGVSPQRYRAGGDDSETHGTE